MPFNNYLSCCGGREDKYLTSDGETLREGGWSCDRVGAYYPFGFWLICVKHAFVQIVGRCVFVYTAVVP